MSKHTEGKWHWRLCKNGSFKTSGDYAQIASGSIQVAKVQIISVTEEDLQLMVAAPELLSALERLVRQYGSDGVCYSGDHPLAVARAAIARATGAA